MRCASLAVAAIGLAGWAASAAEAQFKGDRFGPSAFGYGWLGSLEQGKAQAQQSGKPLMVVIRCVP
jgi:hypothetical protein